MKECSLCKMSKRNDQFLTKRGKPTKLCVRCRGYNHKRKERTIKKEEERKALELVERLEKVQNENVSFPDFITKIKNKIKPKLEGQDKQKILSFFTDKEPKIGEVLAMIRDDELKDIIKVWLNSKYIETIDIKETEDNESDTDTE